VGLLPLALSGQERGRGAAPPPAPPLAANAPFTVAVNTSTIEASPVYVADAGPRGAAFEVINGGVRNLGNGSAHAATNAETQMLLVDNPKVRMLLTVSEGLYRIIARRSAGIQTVADLKGKRVTTIRNTSAHYHLVKMLGTAGLQESDVTIVSVGQTEMAAAVAKRDADAISMWEPEAQNALDALGADATVFPGRKVYRELFSLYTTTDVLNDPVRRRQLVELVRALLAANESLKTRPADHFALIARIVRQPVEKVSRTWEHHAFPLALPADMLDVMVEEDRWIAQGQKRAPRTREQLATFIDTSVLRESPDAGCTLGEQIQPIAIVGPRQPRASRR
jgi:NitT/TauT family transport system substrate-binding protein